MRQPTRRDAMPKHNADTVAGWIALQRKNKWNMFQLSKHLKMGFGTVQTYIEKYELGELP